MVGIISIFLTLIFYITYSLSALGDLTYIYNIFHCRNDMYVCFENFYDYIIYYFLIYAVLQTLISLVCYYFSPEVYAISDILNPFATFIYNTIKNKDTVIVRIVIDFLGYIIIIIGSLIYNENIVCNFWGLNENTWKAITQKGMDEYLGIMDHNGSNMNDEYDFHFIDSSETKKNHDIEMTEKYNDLNSSL